MDYLKLDFQGQKSFKELVNDYFPIVFMEIQHRGFHEGWKFLTKIPKKGNYNPNWRDCERYIDKVISLNLHKKHSCPKLPIERGLVNRRKQCSRENYWLLMSKFCKVYRELATVDRTCKRNGTLISMYNNGEIGCDLFLDTQVEKAEHTNEYLVCLI